MKPECDHMMTKPLDMLSQEILRDLDQAKTDIETQTQSLDFLHTDYACFKTESIKKTQELTIIYKRVEEEHTKCKDTIKELQSDRDSFEEKLGESNEEVSKLKTSHETLQNSFDSHSMDTVPWNMRGI